MSNRHPIFNAHIAVPLAITIAVMSGLSWVLHRLIHLNENLALAIGLPALAVVIGVGLASEWRHSRLTRVPRATDGDSADRDNYDR